MGWARPQVPAHTGPGAGVALVKTLIAALATAALGCAAVSAFIEVGAAHAERVEEIERTVAGGMAALKLEPEILTSLHGELDEMLRRDAVNNFSSFCQYMWDVVNPGTDLIWTPAHDAIAEHAQAVVMDLRKDGAAAKSPALYWNHPLVVTCPPGIGKTYILSICLPCWAWLHNPEWRIFGVSHSIDLAIAINIERRDLIESPKYQWLQQGWAKEPIRLDDTKLSRTEARKEGLDSKTVEIGAESGNVVSLEAYKASRSRNSPAVQIEKGQRLKSYFRNASKGWMRAVSVRSKLTGKHCDLAVIDDPLDAERVGISKRAEVWFDWFQGKFLSRFRYKTKRRVILVMQRLCAGDPAERLLELPKLRADHLNLPNEYMDAHPCPCRGGIAGFKDPEKNPHQNCTTRLGWSDWREMPGELLAPELFDRESTEQRKEADPQTYTTQFQQMVASQDGGEFNPAWLQYWDDHSHAVDMIGTMDPTYGGQSARASWMTIQVWALTASGHVRCLDTLRIQGANGAQHRHALLLMMKRWPDCRMWMVERKALGPEVISEYQRRFEEGGVMIEPYDPDGSKKLARARAWQGHLQGQMMAVPSKDAKRPSGLAQHYSRGNLRGIGWRDELVRPYRFAQSGDYEKALAELVKVDVIPEDERRAEAVREGRFDAEFSRQYEELRRVIVSGWNGAPAWPDFYREELRTFPYGSDDMVDCTSIMAHRWQHRIGRPSRPRADLTAHIMPHKF